MPWPRPIGRSTFLGGPRSVRERDSEVWFRPLDGCGVERLTCKDIIRKIPIYKRVQWLDEATFKLVKEWGVEGENLSSPYLDREFWLIPYGRCILHRPYEPGAELVEVTPQEVLGTAGANGLATPRELNVPRWDSEQLTLYFGEVPCRHYVRRNASNQFKLLAAFQAADFPRSIDSPFDLDRTLRETVDDLNQSLKDSPLRFGVKQRKAIWLPTVAPACSG
jgi:hypothetical protein